MTKWDEAYKDLKHCRWCGKPYMANLPKGKDGFCSDAHKMALTRARKKYVTRKNAGSLDHKPAEETWKNRVTKEPRLIRSSADREAKVNFMTNLKTQVACYSCKEDDYRALEMHHVNKLEKTFNLSECYLFSWEKILIELRKCEVRCSNCHRKGA